MNHGELDIKSSYDEQMLFLTENGGNFADKSIGYSSFREILHIDAKTLIPDKRGFKELPVNEITESNKLTGSTFVDDYKEKSFVFPGVKAGAIADLKYAERISEPRFLGSFYFRSYVPVVASELAVHVDKDVVLKYILMGTTKDQVIFEKSSKGGVSTYKWQMKSQDAMKYEADAPSLNYYEPHIIVYIDGYRNAEGNEEVVLSDVSALYGWYRSLTKDLNSQDDETLKQVTQSLMDGSESEEEKARKVFNWVQDNIKYIAFEEGLGGFIPREAAQVCQKKYGDCKDMASLITEMLRYAGVASNLTWIGTRDIPYTYEDVPTPMVDNHMIASLMLDGKRVFLDATDDQLSFGYPSSFIQGKQALVGNGEEFELVRVPEVSREDNRIEHEIVIKLAEGEVIGSGKTLFTGYPRFNMLRRKTQVRIEREDIFFRDQLGLGNNKFQLGNYELKDAGKRTPSASLFYDFEIKDYGKKIGKELYINMNLDKRLQHAQIEIDKRKRDREFDYKYTAMSKVKLEIPEGYEVEYLPEAASWQNDLFGFEIHYEVIGNEVVLNSEVFINCLLLQKADFPAWNEMINALDIAYTEVLVLEAK